MSSMFAPLFKSGPPEAKPINNPKNALQPWRHLNRIGMTPDDGLNRR
jgi:hypothetical protein